MMGRAWLVLAAALVPCVPGAWAAAAEQSAPEEACAPEPLVRSNAMLQRDQVLTQLKPSQKIRGGQAKGDPLVAALRGDGKSPFLLRADPDDDYDADPDDDYDVKHLSEECLRAVQTEENLPAAEDHNVKCYGDQTTCKYTMAVKMPGRPISQDFSFCAPGVCKNENLEKELRHFAELYNMSLPFFECDGP